MTEREARRFSFVIVHFVFDLFFFLQTFENLKKEFQTVEAKLVPKKKFAFSNRSKIGTSLSAESPKEDSKK
jgi:hypothetical protein